MTEPAGFLLARIDDRLLHGQVAIGWAASLKPARIFVVDDAAASSAWESALYAASPPPGAVVEVLSVDAFAARARDGLDAARSFLLVRSPEAALKLLDLGVALDRLNVGGLRHKEGAREVLAYVWLRPADEEALRRLADRGVKLLARDLPMNPEHDLAALLGW